MSRILSGQLVTGRGQAAGFTQLDWVRRQTIAQAGIDPYPGTVNLHLPDPASIATWRTLRSAPSLTVKPPDSAFCSAQLIPLQLGGLAAAAIIPGIANYPENTIEVVAAVNVREQLALADGHRVTLEPWTNKRVRACVFDVDGTLFDSVNAYHELAIRAARPFGYAVTIEHVRNALVTGSNFWSDVVPGDVPQREMHIRAMGHSARDIWMPVLREHARIFPALVETLQALQRQGIVLGIMTNASPALIELLREAGIAHYFSVIVTNADVKKRKPDPEGIRLCLERMGIAPADAAYVGDTPLDIDASRAAGVHAFGVLTGAGDGPMLTRAGADRLLANLDLLPSLLVGPG